MNENTQTTQSIMQESDAADLGEPFSKNWTVKNSKKQIKSQSFLLFRG